MSAQPISSPRIRGSASHLHASSHAQRPPNARSTTSRTPATTSLNAPTSSSAMSPPATAPLSRNLDGLRTPVQNISKDVRTPSPNYFGLAIQQSDDCYSSASKNARANWSPPNSNVRSTAAASPRVIPVDANPAFEAFRRQSENNNKFNLGNFGGLDKSAMPPPSHTPSATPKMNGKSELSPPKNRVPLSPRIITSNSNETLAPEPPKRSSPKRLLSADADMFPDRPRRNSPASFLEGIEPGQEATFAPQESQFSRPSLPQTKVPTAFSDSKARAETLPSKLEESSPQDGPSMVTPQHIVSLIESSDDEILLLDLRVSTQFARCRITGALNLCIPTTLLKRPSFNVAKLAETFNKDEEAKAKFASWRNSKYIIVYDADSKQLKDATTCLHTLKKFETEGWKGRSLIIRGGFIEFASKFSAFTVGEAKSQTNSRTSSVSVDSDGPSIAPVVGGCPMPATKNAANPFFGNIRQNMDLIGGVGQMSIKQPSAMTDQQKEDLPPWLGRAADQRDSGKVVADKFLQIEKKEQRRMQDALSSNVVYGTPSPGGVHAVKLAGIEKGAKNRYNNIWPFEHSRVKLQGIRDGGCDYVNANHVSASFSHKKYIATQGPIPATFNDFWNVVWQQDARVIVMLTAEQEGGQIKAHNYWSDRHFGPLHLNFLSEHRASLEPEKIHRHKDRPSLGQRRSTNPVGRILKDSVITSPNSEQPYVIVRKFTLSHSDYPFERMREITQLQYSSWPDFGAPAHPAHLLGLVEQCDAVVRSTYGSNSTASPVPPHTRPVIVHCSAGCGRTGTFCTVDTVLDMLRRQRQTRESASQQSFRREASPMDLDKSMSASPERPSPSNPFFSQGKGAMDWSGDCAQGSWLYQDNLDLVEKVVEEFRLQRLSMVQSLRQFVLCYETVLEWITEQQPKTA